MSNSKKSFSFALAMLTALVFVLSACGGGKNSAEEGSPEAGGDSGKTVNLIWYTIGTPQKDVDKVMEEVSKYTKEKINATVTMKMVDWGDYSQKMQVNVASGEPMDILFTASGSGSFDYVQNARKGAFLELDDLLEQYGKDLKNTINPAFLEGSKVDGHNYGIPANKELPQLEAWFFNKSLLDKYNLDIEGVRSLDSLEPLLKTIKEKEPGVTPFAMDKKYIPYVPYDYIIQDLPMAVKLDTTDYKIVNILETPEMQEALKTMHKYYKAGYVAPRSGNDRIHRGFEKVRQLAVIPATNPAARRQYVVRKFWISGRIYAGERRHCYEYFGSRFDHGHFRQLRVSGESDGILEPAEYRSGTAQHDRLRDRGRALQESR